MGGAAPGRGKRLVGLGAGAVATGSHLPHRVVVHPIDGGGSAEAVASTRLCRRHAALCDDDGRGAQPQRRPATPGAEGQAPKKIPETDAIFANIKEKDGQSMTDDTTKRIRIDCKATVNIGADSRGGKTRGDNQAADHDMGCKEKDTPFGMIDEDTAQLALLFGSSAKTSDFIVDSLEHWWKQLPLAERDDVTLLQIKLDNGPESSGRRTQFLHRMVAFADTIGLPIQLLYDPPYHSKDNPVERCWGILEQHWNGTQLVDVTTLLEWAKSMTWKGIKPLVDISRKVYAKGVTLTKGAMKGVEARLERNPNLPKWDILIRPDCG
nr:hypothetical protein [Thiocystis minor]